MSAPFRSFDMHHLHEVLDAERGARGLSWPQLVAEINKPFLGTTSIPISVSTVRTFTNKRAVAGTVVLQILRWLGRSPESFLSGDPVDSQPGEALPNPGPGRILRFDTRALHAALDAERVKRGMTWKQVAAELPDFTENRLRNLGASPLIGFPGVMKMTQWLGRPAARFVRDFSR